MIDIITTLSYYSPYDNPLESLFTVIIFIIIVAYCCKSIDDSSENNDNHNSTQKPAKFKKLNSLDELHGYYGEIDRNGYPKNWSYDPTWDDAYFEKWGTEPWFDDNPQDHEKDK